MDHKQRINNLGIFINNLPKSGVKFLYFGARDPTMPLVRTELGKWKVKSTWCYVAPGVSANYCYTYRKSAVKYLLTAHADASDTPAISVTVAEIGVYAAAGKARLVNHGDHVTFGIERGTAGATVVKTHKTVYTVAFPDPGAPLVFNRDSSAACNFLYPASDA